MTDKLTPPQLRDLAVLLFPTPRPAMDDHANWARVHIANILSAEAARREADARPQTVPNPPYVGPDKAFAEWHAPMGEREDKPDPAADDLAHSLRSVVTVDHRWDAHALSIIRRYEADRHRAADKIDEQARHIAHWRGSFINEQKANEELRRPFIDREKDYYSRIESARSITETWMERTAKAEAENARLREALSDLTDGKDAHRMAEDTGLPLSRCQAIAALARGGDR